MPRGSGNCRAVSVIRTFSRSESMQANTPVADTQVLWRALQYAATFNLPAWLREDRVSGLTARQYFDELLRRDWLIARREARPISLSAAARMIPLAAQANWSAIRDALERAGAPDRLRDDFDRLLLADHPIVGEARSAGLVGALELVRDKATHARFPADKNVGETCRDTSVQQGLVMRHVRDSMIVAPPRALANIRPMTIHIYILGSFAPVRSTARV